MDLHFKENEKYFSSLNDDDWADTIAEKIDNLYYQKADNEELTKSLRNWDIYKDLDNVIIKIIRDYVVEKEKICYLIENLNTLSNIITMLEKTIRLKGSSDYGVIASFLISAYKVELTTQDLDDLLFYVRNFYEETKIDIEDAVGYLKFLRGQTHYAAVPKWVSIQEGENLSLLKTVLPGEPSEAANSKIIEYKAQAHNIFHHLVKNDKTQGEILDLNLEEAVNDVLAAYSSQEDPTGTLSTRIFGPANRFLEDDCISNPYASGPCRMLHCMCWENEDILEKEKIVVDRYPWFDGICNTCLCKIRDISHAIRYPADGGGWKGCFCSLECLKETIINRDEKTNFRINIMMYALENDGIMDRTKV